MSLKIILLSIVALLVSLGTSLMAGDGGKTPQSKSSLEPTVRPEISSAVVTNIALTGSYLVKPVTRSGWITDAPSQVLVVDRKMIQRSGARDIKDLLSRYGANH